MAGLNWHRRSNATAELILSLAAHTSYMTFSNDSREGIRRSATGRFARQHQGFPEVSLQTETLRAASLQDDEGNEESDRALLSGLADKRMSGSTGRREVMALYLRLGEPGGNIFDAFARIEMTERKAINDH